MYLYTYILRLYIYTHIIMLTETLKPKYCIKLLDLHWNHYGIYEPMYFVAGNQNYAVQYGCL